MKTSFFRKARWTFGFILAGALPLSLQAGDETDSTDTGHYSRPRFHTSVSLSEGYDDNTQTTHTDKIASGYTGIQLNSFADLGNNRTNFTIGIGAGLTYYYDRPGGKTDKLASLNVNFAHKLSQRMTLTLTAYLTYQVEPDFTLLVAQNRVNGQYFYTGDNLNLSYQWTRRFSTVTSYQFIGIFYDDSAAKITNDYVTNTFGNQFRYMLKPTTTLVGEYRLGLVNYLYQNNRNSLSNFFLVGFDHSFSPKFTVTLRAGSQVLTQDVGGTTTTPYAEFNMNYAYQRYSNLQGYFRYGFDYSNLGIAQTDRAVRMGVQVNQGITPKLSWFLGFFYQHDDYSHALGAPASATTEDTFSITTGLRYTVNPHFSLSAGYTRTQLLSDNASQEYDRDVVNIGGTYSF